jgi:hypothetical protein
MVSFIVDSALHKLHSYEEPSVPSFASNMVSLIVEPVFEQDFMHNEKAIRLKVQRAST